MRSPRLVLAIALGVAVVGSLSACSKDDSSSSGSSYDVAAGDKTCVVSETSIPAGDASFEVTNTGNQVTEVYVYGKEGDEFTKIMAEVENVGPGTSRDLDVDLAAGDYQVACKPGMVGDGIRADLTVAGEGGSSEVSEAAYDRELEIEVEESGEVQAPAQLSAQVGEKIEFKLENANAEEHVLELLGPDGDELGEAEAPAGADGEFVAELKQAGDYTLKAFAEGAEDEATTLTLAVSTAG